MAVPINRLESIWPRSEGPEALAAPKQAVWTTRAKSWENRLEDFLAEYPKAAILAAAAVGIAIGWIVKRK
jgi:hypothetical protein